MYGCEAVIERKDEGCATEASITVRDLYHDGEGEEEIIFPSFDFVIFSIVVFGGVFGIVRNAILDVPLGAVLAGDQ